MDEIRFAPWDAAVRPIVSYAGREGVRGVAQGRRVPERDGFETDAAARFVDAPRERDAVRKVMRETQIGDDVPDFLALIESDAAYDAIGNVVREKNLFHDARLGVGAVQYDKIVKGTTILRCGGNLARDKFRLVALIACGIGNQFLSPVFLRPQLFVALIGVVTNHMIGGDQNVLRGTVVLLEGDHGRVRVIFLKFENVADIRLAPPIDGLVVIADDEEVTMLSRKERDEEILRVIRVLILVHEDVAEAVLIALQNIGIFREQFDGKHKEIVKVERVVFTERLFVRSIHLGDDLFKITTRMGDKITRTARIVLCPADRFLYRARRKLFRIDAEIFQCPFDYRQLIVRVKDRE